VSVQASIPDKTVERLILYRSLLKHTAEKGTRSLFSHQIADLVGGTAAQVRRDLMAVGYTGNPREGYKIEDLVACIDKMLNAPEGFTMALVGVGNLGRAILNHFAGLSGQTKVLAAFDIDSNKVGRVICGCRCHHISEIKQVLTGYTVNLGVITVPVTEAQTVADRLVEAGVRGLVNFTPVPVKVPSSVYMEHMELATVFEKVAFFSRH
jgi:redox-sensing transcriptional repressor